MTISGLDSEAASGRGRQVKVTTNPVAARARIIQITGAPSTAQTVAVAVDVDVVVVVVLP